MSDQLSMFGPMISEDTPSATSSLESESGVTPCVSQDGPTTAKSGPGRAPASPSARPAKAKRSTTKGIFGQSSFASSRHEDLSFALGNKLRPLTDSLGSTLFSLTWMTRITPAGRSISALRASEPLTEGSVFIGWPTPKAADIKGNHYEPDESCRRTELRKSVSLAAWPTPQCSDDNISRGSAEFVARWLQREKSGSQLAATATLASWPTTRAIDGEKGQRSEAGLAAEIARKGHLDELPSIAQLVGWKTPTTCTPNSLRGSGQEPSIREAGGHAVNLQDQVRLAGWKTPCVPNGGGNTQDLGKHRDGTKAQIGLENEAKLSGWTTPRPTDENMARRSPEAIEREMNRPDAGSNLAIEAQLTAFGDGPIGYLLGPNGWEIVPASGQLNASHSRWLMGLPAIWDVAGIAAFRSLKKRKRGSVGSADTETA